MTAEIIQFNRLIPKVKKRKRGTRARVKKPSMRYKTVYWGLIGACQALGPPDYKLINEVLDDLEPSRYNLKDMDIFAIYLYRKKLKG